MLIITYQILIAAIYALPFFLLLTPISEFLFFLLGLALGLMVLLLDEHLFYRYYAEDLGDSTDHHSYRLITRSLLFMIVYICLAVFIVTSGGTVIGNGVIMGLGIGLLVEMIIYKKSEIFNNRFLWQLKKFLLAKDINKLIAVFLLIMVILNFLWLK